MMLSLCEGRAGHVCHGASEVAALCALEPGLSVSDPRCGLWSLER